MLAIFGFSAHAQIEKCATMQILEKRIAKDPSIKLRMEQSEIKTQKWIAANPMVKKGQQAVITIPVVFHIIHTGELIGTGSNIRDGETGEYYSEKVGTKQEDLYFKVSLATGECKSLNGSTTLFYLSPEHYERHLYVELDNETKLNWEDKKNVLLVEMEKSAKKNKNKNRNNTYEYVTIK